MIKVTRGTGCAMSEALKLWCVQPRRQQQHRPMEGCTRFGPLSQVENRPGLRVNPASPFSQVSVKHMRLHSRYSFCSLVSADSSSILLGRDLTFPMMTDGMDGLHHVFFSQRFVPARHPLLLLLNSVEIAGISVGSTLVLLSANSCSQV